MGKKEGFQVEIASDYEQFWCYNVVVMCGCFDEEGNQVDFVSAEEIVAPVNVGLKCKPSGYPSCKTIRFNAPECDHLHMHICIIPHTLPLEENGCGGRDEFAFMVKISHAEEVIHNEQHRANRWSGVSLEVNTGEL